MQLIFVRHAEPHNHSSPRGIADPDLTSLGEVEAERVAAFLRAESIAAIFSSPARRAVATAQPLAKLVHAQILTRIEFAEFNYGSSEYLSVGELRLRNDPRWQALVRGEIYDCPVSAEELRARITRAIDTVVAEHAGETVAVFTHSGVINLYVGGIIGMDRPIWTAPAHASISRVLADGSGRRTLLSLNETIATRLASDALHGRASSYEDDGERE